MVRSKRLLVPVTLACIIGVFVIALLYFILHSTEEGQQSPTSYYDKPLLIADATTDPFAELDDDFKTTRDFSSNLPILVFSVAGEKVNGTESGMLSVYYWENETNSLLSSPTQSVRVQVREESTNVGVKPDMDITLLDQKGEPGAASLLGMSAESTWHLNSLRKDPSMVRTYTAYRTASQIMDDVPRTAFCEVLYERDGELYYQGLYGITENIGVGPGKVDISAPREDQTRVDYFLVSDTMRRGRLISTRQIDGKYLRGYTSLLYPNEEDLSRDQIKYIEKEYNTITERVSALNDYEILLDVNSLIDYYIVNLYFGNSNAGKTMTYMSDTINGKLRFGPIYDFDLALGNLNGDASDPDEVSYDLQIFLNELVNDNSFVTKLLRRFIVLRRTVLREEVVYAIIDEARDYLRIAKQRDDKKWRGDQVSEGIFAIYRTGTIESTEDERDFYRMKAYLSKHASEVRNTFAKIEEEQRIQLRFEGGNTLLLFVSLVLFFIPSILINRKG